MTLLLLFCLENNLSALKDNIFPGSSFLPIVELIMVPMILLYFSITCQRFMTDFQYRSLYT